MNVNQGLTGSSVPAKSCPCRAGYWRLGRTVLNLVLAAVTICLLTAENVRGCGAPAPIQCARSTSLVKAFAGPMIVAPIGGAVVIPVSVFVSATTGAMPPCPAPISTTVTLTSACAPPPSSAPGSIVIPTPTPGLYGGAVVLFFPPDRRVCVVTGSATTTWVGGSVTVGFGDITICLVDPAPGSPTTPRLDMQLLTPAEMQAHPGDGRTHIIRVTNNDPVSSVTGTFTSTSNQNGRLSTMSPPPAPGSGDGPGSTATPFTGDALPLDFGDPLTTPCVPLPDPDANTTFTVTKPITLAPGETRFVQVRQRSYPMCRSGSCSEALMKFMGTFSDSTNALACCQATFMVNSLVPPDFGWPDNGMMTRAIPSGPMIVHQGNMPTHTFAGGFQFESTPSSPGVFFNFFGPSTQVMDQGYGDNMGRVRHDYQAAPPLNVGQSMTVTLNVHIDSLVSGITSTLQSAMVKPGDSSLGDTYFHIMTRSKLSGPGIPPTLDSFFDVFYAVSLDGISSGLHRPGRIFPGSIVVTPTGPTTMTLTFQGVFEPAPGLPLIIPNLQIHVDPIANLIGVPPAHDNCTGAYPLTEGVQFSGDTTNAIGTSDGPPGTCTSGLFHSVWHTFTPATSGTFHIDTCGTNFDTVLVAFTGADCNSLVQVGCDDDSSSGTLPSCTPSGAASRIENIPLTGGQTYWVRVGGFNTSTNFGPYKVLVTRVAALGPCCIGRCCTITNQANCAAGTWLGPGGTCNPNPCGSIANDECAAALAATVGANPGSNCGATTSFSITPTAQCGTFTGSGGIKDVWRSFTPSQSANYTMDTCATPGFDTVLALYDSCPANGTVPPRACNDDAGPTGCAISSLRSRIANQLLVAGQTYLIRVASYDNGTGGSEGDYVLNITQGAAAGACCTGTSCAIALGSTCPPANYRGDFTSCLPNPCAPLGACCFANACTPTIQTNCPGTWLAGTPCNPYPCRGACCCGSTCSVQGDNACNGANTRFVGIGVACNPPGNNLAPCCRADYNQSGAISVQDIFDFLAAYFSASGCADINGSGVPPTVQDIFDFLAAYFAGGC